MFQKGPWEPSQQVNIKAVNFLVEVVKGQVN